MFVSYVLIWVKTTKLNRENHCRISFFCDKRHAISDKQDLMVKLQRVYARMTWLGEAMKDGVSTDMPRVAANRL